jgi:cytochrome c-type biogenesis protein CcmH/NrfG
MDRATGSSSSGPGNTEDLLRKSVREEPDRAKQWLLLKPTVMRLLAREGGARKSHADIVAILKEQYDFNAL